MTITMENINSRLIISLLFLAASSDATDTAVSYAGHRVVRIVPTTDADLTSLLRILKDFSALVDVWQGTSHPGNPVDVHVPPKVYPKFIRTLTSSELTYSVNIDDIQQQIDVEKTDVQETRSRIPTNIVGSYAAHADILTWLSNLASTNAKVTVQSYGTSLENRNLTVVKISKSNGAPKPIIFIEAGCHAREWISPATAIWIINKLATGATAGVTSMLAAADWYIVPVANPDGYEYSRLTNRLWRKNRSVNQGSACRGVDLNRNYDSHWMLVGGSNDPCSDVYAGPSVASEPETTALSSLVLGIKSDVKAYFSLHSYSQSWLTSWGYTTTPAPDSDVLLSVAKQGAKTLKAVHGTTFTVGPGATALYAASGCSDDWAKEKAGIKYSYTLELRDTGHYGFLLPASQIVPTATETWTGIKTAVNLILSTP